MIKLHKRKRYIWYIKLCNCNKAFLLKTKIKSAFIKKETSINYLKKYMGNFNGEVGIFYTNKIKGN